MEISIKQFAEQFKLVVDEFDVKNAAEAAARRIKYITLRASGLSVKQAKRGMMDARPTHGDVIIARDAFERGCTFQQAVNFAVHGR